MKGVKLNITGDKKLLKTLNAIDGQTRLELEDALDKAAFAVKTTAVKKIQRSPASGRTYTKYSGKTGSGKSSKRKHRASAPGEPPKTDIGNLVKSIETTRIGLDAYVFTEIDYGKFLELGTIQIRPRPWLAPSYRENLDKIPKGIGKAVMTGAKKAAKKS